MPLSSPLISKSPFELASENATTEESVSVNTEMVASAIDSLNIVSVNLPLTIPALLCATTVSTDKCIIKKNQIDFLIKSGKGIWVLDDKWRVNLLEKVGSHKLRVGYQTTRVKVVR